jgi:hypothetical protein
LKVGAATPPRRQAADRREQTGSGDHVIGAKQAVDDASAPTSAAIWSPKVLRCDILRLAGTDTPRLKPAEDRLSQSVAAPPRAPPFVRERASPSLGGGRPVRTI